MPQGKEVFLGLNQNGVILFILLIVISGPCFCWIPFLIDSCKAEKGA
ncbi:hypothetical protein Psta_0846 [Pirellula staleyi DSM 6068]|uniref:Uncharacterized protein n=1 Tax=Pirellula staleyi (strain ATCC 27377 / DSM 6068 / ICPB 4128) TaxID=530564 RepID=D2R6F3_PIRSD|nr:hypothetical protein [Pirellula staleyi]ADB15531.1 hypothetical protein Psta_0846 [Pirellula staleyi DSM 6068]